MKKYCKHILSICIIFALIFNICVFQASAYSDYDKTVNQAMENFTLLSDNSTVGYSVTETEIDNGHKFLLTFASVNKDDVASTYTTIPTGFYLEVEIYGSAGKVYGTVSRLGSFGSCQVRLELWAGDTYASKRENYTTLSSIPASPNYASVVHTMLKSAFCGVTLTGVIDGESFSYSTYEYLFNKKAAEYPSELMDCYGNIQIAVPSSASWSKVSNGLGALSPSQNKAYKSWYETTYNRGKTLDWTDVEIHHVKPRAYGGTHDYENLMPLKHEVHTAVSTWWKSY